MSSETNVPAMLRPMLPADVPVLAAIFQASIEELAEDDYDESQRTAWMAVADDETEFGAKLTGSLTVVATIKSAPVGFVSLQGVDQIDMLYVYPRMARQGVGSLLYDAIEKLAVGRGAKRLTVDASDTARSFFEAKGFEGVSRQTVELGGCWLGNTRMEKKLAA